MPRPYYLLKLFWFWMWADIKILSQPFVWNSNFVENTAFFWLHMLSLKKWHYFRCPQSCQVPAHCFMIPAFYGKKTNPKCQHSFYITMGILEKCHYWVSYLFLFIHEWIMLELTWAIVHYLLFLWIWCLAEVLKVWWLLNVMHFPLLCVLLAKRVLLPFFCYLYFGVTLLKIRVILKIF